MAKVKLFIMFDDKGKTTNKRMRDSIEVIFTEEWLLMGID